MASLPSPTQVAKDHFGLYEAWFRKLDASSTGHIPAGVAAQFLQHSGLNTNILSRIWDISDVGAKGYLDKAGLFVAMKLVALAQNGHEPIVANINIITSPPNMGEAPPHPAPPKSPGPPPVPAPPPPVATQTQSSNSGVWTITPNDRQRYDQIFSSLGPEANKIAGNKVRGVMMNSKLPMDVLGKIWDHADMDKDGSLDKVEFSIAMHLIYKVLENNPLPATLPQDMLLSARRAGVAGQGPVPAPLAPPSLVQTSALDNNKLKDTGPPPAPWVVTASDKARYDIMFHNADIDKDGFVSGQEIKGIFLQSGLPQMVLAHIWNICDMKQTGKLTSEQFALAMFLIQQKIAGIDPPSTLSPEMVPPSMRPKPTEATPIITKPSYSNPELQAVADEIDGLGKDRLKLESDVQQKEASIRLKNNENKNLQTELDTLLATLKQLENQKGAAQKRLDDLGVQRNKEESILRDTERLLSLETFEVESLKTQVEEQEGTLKEQEDEVQGKQKELDDLRAKELELEASIMTSKKRIEQFSNTQQETQLFLSQARVKIEEMQEKERHMTEALTGFDSVLSSSDATSIPESFLIDVIPSFNDADYTRVGPPTPKTPISPEEPFKNEIPEANGLPEGDKIAIPKGKDTSFIGGQDPFAQAFGGNRTAGDPFSSWDNSRRVQQPTVAAHDPFGSDSFAQKVDEFGNEPFAANKEDISEGPALPPKKAKPAPPRPAPPKARPAKPPPPQINSNNNPKRTKDSFEGAWNDTTSNPTKSDGFADFANFASFDNQYSSAPLNSRRSPWGTESKTDAFGAPSIIRSNGLDPFEDSFSVRNNKGTSSYCPWPINSPSSGFGSQNGSDHHAEDPFGGDYDPFKDTTTLKESDEFSWDDEPDGTFTDSISERSLALPRQFGPKKDFYLSSEESPENKRGHASLDKIPSGTNVRSKSALGDPHSAIKASLNVPSRSKTSLGNLRNLDLNFDPLANSSNQEFPAWKSNEDLLNENLVSSGLPARTSNNNFSWNTVSDPFNNYVIGSDSSHSFSNSWKSQEPPPIEEHNRNKRPEYEGMDQWFAMVPSQSLNQSRTTKPPVMGHSFFPKADFP